MEFAAQLNVSEKTIQRARKRLLELGWVRIKPGRQANGQNLATQYLGVVDSGFQSAAELGRNPSYTQVHRHTFEALLNQVLLGKEGLSHEDNVVYWYLVHWFDSRARAPGAAAHLESFKAQWRLPADRPLAMYVPKRHLAELTGVDAAVASVGRLYSNWQFNEGIHLFEYVDCYRNLVFSSFGNQCMDPSEDARNAKAEASMRTALAARVQERRNTKLGLPP